MALLLAFIVVPLIEIALFVQLGSVLDLGWILLIVVLTAILGTYLVRRQGRGVLRELMTRLDRMEDPSEPLAHGAMVLFSGALLLTPGFFTDTVGFLLLIPAVREIAFRQLRRRVVIHGLRERGRGPARTVPPREDVIDGDFEEVPPGDPKHSRGSSGWTRH